MSDYARTETLIKMSLPRPYNIGPLLTNWEKYRLDDDFYCPLQERRQQQNKNINTLFSTPYNIIYSLQIKYPWTTLLHPICREGHFYLKIRQWTFVISSPFSHLKLGILSVRIVNYFPVGFYMEFYARRPRLNL